MIENESFFLKESGPAWGSTQDRIVFIIDEQLSKIAVKKQLSPEFAVN
jgi:hypothetical protein